ncbi:MFS transporter [Niveispirillum sp.]|uniref:MFS transporter n=1 Tax=Niveispirillum sp. TaxID=1917217 RepID=UPI001B4F467F|nr:MFS transporter [Niveispirillum sp.]MBP7340405.1 MFS transporter [Niveispirillum sp.]
MPQVANFTAEVRDGPIRARQVAVLVTLGLLVLFDGMDTQMLGVIANDLTRDLGLSIANFGLVFSFGLLGGIAGALFISPLADRLLGRKTITVASMAVASLATIATPLATNLYELLVMRFIAGVGLGAALPSIFALVAEFSPKRFSRPITSSLIAFMPLGSFLGGLIGRLVVPDHGWPMLLYVGGGLTLVLTLLAAWILPESVYFLARIKNNQQRALKAARALLPDLRATAVMVEDADGAAQKKQPVARLFAGGFWKFTLLIWLAYIMNQGILYFVLSWTPALLQKSGLATAAGMDAAAMFGLGGALGTALQGWLATKVNIHKLMFAEMALYLVAILTLPFILHDGALTSVAVFFIAVGICAYQAGFILIVVESYPNDIRATGFGWALGIGRIGATAAPVLAGLLVGLGWGAGQIFVAAAVPGIISVTALLLITLLVRQSKSASQP